MNKILIILNPAARGERASQLRERILALAPEASLRATHFPGEAADLARQGLSEGFTTIIAAGGDGTVNEVVNGIADSEACLGILPVGTMNVFALEMGIPSDLALAWKVIEQGHVLPINLPKANEGVFVQLAGVGLDAEVVRATSSDAKKMLGPLSYLLSLVQVASQQPPDLEIRLDDRWQRQGKFVLIGNGRFYGGPFELFPNARLDDGLLDVLIFKNQSHWDVIRYMQAIAFRSHARLPDVEYLQCRSLVVESKEGVSVELDGEFFGVTPCHFSLMERPLKVLAPKS